MTDGGRAKANYSCWAADLAIEHLDDCFRKLAKLIDVDPLSEETLPTLRNEHVLGIEPGMTLRAGLRLLGRASVALAGMVDAIGRHGLALGGIRFVLQAAHDGTGRLLYDRRFPNVPAQAPALMHPAMEPEQARHIRIVFYTPTILKLDRRPAFDPVDLAARFFEQSLARDTMFCRLLHCLSTRKLVPKTTRSFIA